MKRFQDILLFAYFLFICLLSSVFALYISNLADAIFHTNLPLSISLFGRNPFHIWPFGLGLWFTLLLLFYHFVDLVTKDDDS